MAKTFYVNCPCCKALLEVDAETGDLVNKWTPSDVAKPGEDKMTAALKKLEEDKKKRESLLDNTKSRLEEKRKRVDDAFKKEVEKVKKEGVSEKPFSPFDLD